MRTPLVLRSSFVAFAFGAAAAVAQERPAAAPAAAPAASRPMDCSSGAMRRHDYGSERNNAPSSKSMPCAPEAAASGAKSKAKPIHDHAKVHKNQ